MSVYNLRLSQLREAPAQWVLLLAGVHRSPDHQLIEFDPGSPQRDAPEHEQVFGRLTVAQQVGQDVGSRQRQGQPLERVAGTARAAALLFQELSQPSLLAVQPDGRAEPLQLRVETQPVLARRANFWGRLFRHE